MVINKTKRFCAIALAALMSVSVFAGCNGDTPSTTSSTGGDTVSTAAESNDSANAGDVDPLGGEGANGTINLKVWGPETYQSLLTEQCNKFAEEYAQYGDIKIEVVPQGEDASATQLLTDTTSAADVFGFACDTLNKLVASGALYPVIGADEEEVKANNTEASVNAATIDGTLYAYPETGDNSYVLVYDKSVVSDEQAKTLEGVFEACKAANKKFVMNCGDGFYSCLFAFTGGLTIDGFDEDGETQKFSDYDETKVVATLKAFHELFVEYKDYFLDGEVSKIVDGFKSGTVGAGFDGSWNFTLAKEALGDNAGFAALPTINVDGEDTPIVNMFGYKLLGVNSSTQYPNTACELAKYLSGEQCQQERAEQLNWGPSNVNVAESDFVKNDPALTAIIAQQSNSIAQMNIQATLWTPMGTLGSNIADTSKTWTDDDYKSFVTTTIANVRDE